MVTFSLLSHIVASSISRRSQVGVRDVIGRDRMVVGFTISYATNVVSSNPTQERCVRYNIM
jgi:hypothetical protein